MSRFRNRSSQKDFKMAFQRERKRERETETESEREREREREREKEREREREKERERAETLIVMMSSNNPTNGYMRLRVSLLPRLR
jgi:hypothetical protein